MTNQELLVKSWEMAVQLTAGTLSQTTRANLFKGGWQSQSPDKVNTDDGTMTVTQHLRLWQQFFYKELTSLKNEANA